MVKYSSPTGTEDLMRKSNPPRRTNAKILDGEIDAHDDGKTKKILESVVKSLDEIKTRREKRLAEIAARRPPDLTPEPCIVAFIDILGFGNEIVRAKTQADLQKLHDKVRQVQAAFQKDSASEDPAEQKEFNRQYGRRVIALSDAVVVVFSPTSEASEVMGDYDRLGFVISELLEAQARCVIDHGIFVRGGVSHGPFFFEDDILLSPALARAYELECKFAEQPIIVISETTRDEILGVPKQGYTAPGWDPTPNFFRRHGRKYYKGEKLYYLNYLPYILNEEFLTWDKVDHDDFIDARKKGDPIRAQSALERRQIKNILAILRGHRQRIENAYAEVNSERVRKKYRWLMKYHNRSFNGTIDCMQNEKIEISNFMPL